MAAMICFSLLWFLPVLSAVLLLVATPFRSSSLSAFTAKFFMSNSAIQQHKKERLTAFMLRASNGTLFKRPASKPTWLAHMTYHAPMWGVLQSSYNDAEHEVNALRKFYLDKRFLFVGGDGLSIVRINHLLKDHPDLYLDSTFFIIPVQGESPPGV
eukprot:6191963-Pleurochrysis_carterae.AAC.4